MGWVNQIRRLECGACRSVKEYRLAGKARSGEAPACGSCGSQALSEDKTKRRYRVYYLSPSGEQKSKTFRRLDDARDFTSTVETDKKEGDWFDPARGKVKFGDWAEEWLASAHALEASSRARVEIVLRNDLLPHLAKQRLAEIDPDAVQRLVNGWVKRGWAPATVRKSYYILSAIMRAAKAKNHIKKSPCVGIDLPKVQRDKMGFLTPEELHRLAEEVPDRYKTLVLTAGYLGLRWSELAGLKVDAIRFLSRELDVREKLVEVGGHLRSGAPKTEASERTVTMPAFLADALAEQIRRWPSAEGYVFTSPEGGPLRKNFIAREFRPAVRRAGLPHAFARSKTDGLCACGLAKGSPTHARPLRFHDLRHSAASIAIAQGAHPKVIQQRLGHASIRTTLDRYGHVFPKLDEALAESLEALYQASNGKTDRGDVVSLR